MLTCRRAWMCGVGTALGIGCRYYVFVYLLLLSCQWGAVWPLYRLPAESMKSAVRSYIRPTGRSKKPAKILLFLLWYFLTHLQNFPCVRWSFHPYYTGCWCLCNFSPSFFSFLVVRKQESIFVLPVVTILNSVERGGVQKEFVEKRRNVYGTGIMYVFGRVITFWRSFTIFIHTAPVYRCGNGSSSF